MFLLLLLLLLCRLTHAAAVCVLFLKSIDTGNRWREVGRTEMIQNTHDPSFAKHIDVQYCFEEVGGRRGRAVCVWCQWLISGAGAGDPV